MIAEILPTENVNYTNGPGDCDSLKKKSAPEKPLRHF